MQAHGGGVMEHSGMYYWYGEDKNGETFKPWSIMCVPLEPFGCLNQSQPVTSAMGTSVKSASKSMFLKQHITVKIWTQMPSLSPVHPHAVNVWWQLNIHTACVCNLTHAMRVMIFADVVGSLPTSE